MAKKGVVLPPHRIETWHVAELLPAEYNPRKIGKAAMAGLTASVERFGAVQPIIVNERTGRIVGGHQRLKALQALGQDETTVVVVDLSEPDERALNVTLNNPHIAGEFSDGLGIGDKIKTEGGGKKFARHGKPAALLIEHLTQWTPPWEMVFDPFIGTGTSIIAAERMGRDCCGIEMDPQRCQDVIDRWERETGGRAIRVVQAA